MRNFKFLFYLFYFSTFMSLFAQLTVKDQEPSPNTLIKILDEGNFGSIFIPFTFSFPPDPDHKLFNYGGKLIWNGLELGSTYSAAGWTYAGNNILTSTVNDKVGIGMSNAPSVKLSLGRDITTKKFALFDGVDDFYGFGVDWGRITIYTNNTEKMTIKDNGNVGIGTTNPNAKLEVNGDVKIGVDGIKFSEIIELTGTTGTSRTDLPYPSGYNKTNTRVISYQVEDNLIPPGIWVSGFDGLWVGLEESNIKIGHEASWFNGQPYRLMLMKVE